MKIIKINYKNSIPNNFTGIAIFPDGRKCWYKEGKYHREDGPAIESLDGTKYWYKECELHRINGPAIEYPNGTKEWWIENQFYSPEKLLKLMNSSLFLRKEKGRYNLKWLKFLTEEGIDDFPIILGIKQYKDFKIIFNRLKG